MSQVTVCCDNIKTLLGETSGTPTQKLIAILVSLGIEKTADQAALIGVTERAIQKAKTNSSSANHSSEANHSSPNTNYSSPEANSSSRTPVREANSSSPKTNPSSVARIHARVEETNLLTNLETTVVQESKILLRANAPKPKREAHGTRLPSDWTLPDDWRQWARVTFPQTTAERLAMETETFRDYWIAAAGQRGRKADWAATWRNWCRKAFATAPIRPRAADGERHVSPWEAEKQAKHARIRAMLETVGGSA